MTEKEKMELTRQEFLRLIRVLRWVIEYPQRFIGDNHPDTKLQTILDKLEWKFDREYHKGMP